MKFVAIDGCPVPERLAPVLTQIKRDTGCVYQSVYRGSDPNGVRILEQNGKHNQAWLFAHLPRGVANPPGFSTHELKNDGSAYRLWPRGAPIPWWACGIDVDDPHVKAFIASAARHGYTASITYPSSPVEYHHVNFRKVPRVSVWLWRPVKRGMRGRRAKNVTNALAYVHDAVHDKPYLEHGWGRTGALHRSIDANVVDAIKRFQRDHHQKADGVVGLQTIRALRRAVRHRKAKLKGKK